MFLTGESILVSRKKHCYFKINLNLLISVYENVLGAQPKLLGGFSAEKFLRSFLGWVDGLSMGIMGVLLYYWTIPTFFSHWETNSATSHENFRGRF